MSVGGIKVVAGGGLCVGAEAGGGAKGLCLTSSCSLALLPQRTLVLVFVLPSPKMVPPPLLILLSQHPRDRSLPIPAMTCHHTGEGWGRRGRHHTQADPWRLISSPSTLWVPRWPGDIHTPALCTGT